MSGGARVVVDELDDVERELRINAGEHVKYLVPVVAGLAEPRTRRVVLAGKGARLEVAGLFLGQSADVQKLTFDIIHDAPHTTSSAQFRGVMTDRATLDLNGVIHITKAGQGTDAFLEERALLLSPDALATTIPSLEIEANDVRCRHAAAAGPVDPEALFYLRSRGVSPEEAEALLVRGFLHAVLSRLPSSIQEHVHQVLNEVVGGRW